MNINIETANQGVAAGPNPFYVDPEPRRLNTIEEVALEYVHDLRRDNDALGKLAFQANATEERFAAQMTAVRAKNTELEKANRDLRQEIDSLRKANKGFANAAVKPAKPKPSIQDALKSLVSDVFDGPDDDDDGPSPDPDGDCGKCPVTDCDLNDKFVGSKEAQPKPAETMNPDILAKYAAQGEAAVKAVQDEIREQHVAAFYAKHGYVPRTVADPLGQRDVPGAIKPNSDPYYKAPEGHIDGEKAVRQGHENLEAFKRDINGG